MIGDARGADCFLPHVAEGIDHEARNEFLCLSSDENGGVDLTEPNAAFTHSVGLRAIDGQEMAVNGTAVIWSPRTNICLYGNTAPVTMFAQQGVLIGLGTDWTATGSINMLRELACADYLNQQHFAGYFSDHALWRMATVGGARALHIDDWVGSLEAGLMADIAIYRDAGADTPFRAVIEADVDDVALVLRGGVPLYGDTSVMDLVPGGQEGCESLTGGVCGVDKTVCVQREVGTSFDSLASANSGSYDLFFCGAPPDEPTCVPTRPAEYDGPTGTDMDGDGVGDDSDNCPTVFNPVRVLDDGVQADHDGDGLGDVCDPCPMDADTEECSTPDPNDRDGDGEPDDTDNCPSQSNPEQEDGDDDGLGDLCDPCPADANPGGAPCPATIYEVKQGTVSVGSSVAVTGVVTAGGEGGPFFVQVPEAQHDAELGYRYSGVYVYLASSQTDLPAVAVGDVVEVWGAVTNFFDQIEIASVSSVTLLESALPVPTPVTVSPAAVATDGDEAWDYEGVLIEVRNAEVTSLDPPAHASDSTPINEFVVDDSLRVNDFYYLMDPFPFVGDVLDITGVLRFAYGDSKLEPRDENDVVVGGIADPRLATFGPGPVYVDEGASDVSATPPLAVTIDRPAPAGGTQITLNPDDDGHVGVARSVTIPEGEQSVEVLLSGLTATESAATITVSLDGDELEAQVVVVAAGREPVPATVTFDAETVSVGAALAGLVTLDIPAPVDTTVALSAAPAGLVTVPSEVVVGAGDRSAAFDVAGVAEGTATVTAAAGGGQAQATLDVTELPALGLVLSEVYYDAPSTDTGLEWVEIYNGTGSELDLTGYAIGSGGTTYTNSVFALSGTMPAGACWVVGGPTSSESNGAPVYDIARDFEPDIQNAGTASDGVALFAPLDGQVNAGGVPIDAVIYDEPNSNGLIDETGAAGEPDVGDADSGSSIERHADGWVIQATPTPNDCTPLF